MIPVILKQIWNNRRSNGWLFAELFIVFVILWYVTDFLFTALNVSVEPKGYDTHQVYHVSVAVNPTLRAEYAGEAWTESYMQMFRQIREYPGVESACYYGGTVPYEEGYMFQGYTTDSLHAHIGLIRMVSKEFFDVFKVEILQGDTDNWDVAAYPRPAVLSQELADSLFRGKPQIGQPFMDYYAPTKKYTLGAVSPRTKLTEYDRYQPFIYVPVEEWMLASWSPVIAVRVQPGADSGFAERFTADMRRLVIGPFYLSQVKSYDEAKEIYDTRTNNYIRSSYAILLFFIFNVFLGVAGTFWFRTRKRKSEIGLRMAMGASRSTIFREFTGEGILILCAAAVLAIPVCFNIWFADVTVNIWMDATLPRFIIGITVTLLLLLIMLLAGIGYPAWQAMKTKPAEALHEQ